jgi:hypothetical protein
MTLTAIAAFVAAGLSLINILITSWFVRRGQLEQWRRDAERPIVARVLALSDKCLEIITESANQKAMWIQSLETGQQDTEVYNVMLKLWDAAGITYDELRVEGAQLELVGGRDLRGAVDRLLTLHEGLRHVVGPAGGAEGPDQVAREYGNDIRSSRAELVDRPRADLGLERRLVASRERLGAAFGRRPD